MVNEILFFFKNKRLPTTGLTYGKNGPAASTSYEIFQYLKNHDNYDVIHFQSSKGSAYYTLQGKRQGLICLRANIVVSVDSIPASQLYAVNHNNLKMVVNDVETLKIDFMQQKSIEYAVSFFFFLFLFHFISFPFFFLPF